MFPVQNGLICWLDAMDGKAGDTLLKDRTSYGHNLIVENFQQGYGFTGTSIKVKQSKIGTSNNNALYIANGGFKTSCKSFCICIERHNTNQPWYIFDGRGLNGQGLSTNHCFNGNTGSSYDNSKTRRDGVLTYDNSNLDTNKKTFLYFELKEAELFTLSILMRCSKNENTEGEFYSLYAYNRALTEEEILQNMEYENNKISYVNENNLPKIVDKLSNASNIKITGNKYGNRVQTVIDKIVEKADDVTKAIKQEVINNSYSFKVGTGNVDVSADVEDGFGEVGIKGVTYQNLIIPNSMTKPNNVIIDGDIVTLLDSYNTFEGITYKALTKKNTTYTVVLDVKELFKDGIGYKIQINDGAYLYNEPLKPGINVIKIATKENGDNYHIAILKVSTAVGTMKFSKKILLLEGDHTNNPNLPSYFEGIVGVGDKSKNLFSEIINAYPNGTVINTGRVETKMFVAKVKPNTEYTVSEIKGNYNRKQIVGMDSYPTNDTPFTTLATSFGRFTTGDNTQYVGLYYTNDINVAGKDFVAQLEEGSVATSYEPYYDGYKIEILSNGKNLVNPLIPYPYDIKKNEYNDGALLSVVKVKPNTTYTMSVDRTNEKGRIVAKFSNRLIYKSELNGGVYSQSSVYNFLRDNYANGRKFEYTIQTGSKITFTTLDDCNFIYLNTDGAYGGPFNNGEYVTTINNVQIEEGTTATSYVPYKEDKIEIFLDEPLMKLPNGVYDEITKDGKLIRRIKKVVVDSSKEWRKSHESYDSDTNITFDFIVDNITNGWTTGDNKICNILFSKSGNKSAWNGQSEGISNDMNSKLFITLNKSKLQSQNIQGLKTWLDSNPVIIVYYELKTPIITDLSESKIRIFKDGHLTFNTLVAPESTHYVQLNKSGQIQNAIKESQSLDNRINVLENNYDNLMLSTISRLNDLELDYTLK